ncbi:MAG: phage Gp37/Gp68 family protein [Sedimentisphaerales bacterium]|nr:phage Gp37/Gp68 family protein [Sedimentisphaerales bacterium]
MATQSTIEWTESTWNPVSGCTKISTGCLNCYAERMARRLQAMGQKRYQNGFKVTLHPDALDEPYRWKKPRVVFVNSMSDLFHEAIPVEFLQNVFAVMNASQRHTFQILTKRSQRLRELAHLLEWSDNIWMGVTVESEEYRSRIDDLREVNCAVRFLSLEPLLGPMQGLDLAGMDWVIVGGESGPGARPMKEEWVVDIQQMCEEQDVPFFFKQWGGVNKKKAGRVLQGRTWDQYPKAIEQRLLNV